MKRFTHPAVIGLALFLVAFLIRSAGVGWGLPDDRHDWSYHPDEPVIWSYSRQVKPAEGKFAPGFYNYGTLYLTLLSVSTDFVNVYGGAPDPKDPEAQVRALGKYHLAGRVLGCLAGAGIAWVVFLILWSRTHWVGAVFGGLATAVAPGLVVHSRFQTVDVPAVFFLTLGLLWCLRIQGADKVRAAVLAGLFFGLSAGTKYTGLLGLLPLAVVCGMERKWRDLVAGAGVCLVAFVVTTPGILIDNAKFMRDFLYEMAHTSEGHGLVFAGTAPGFLYHLTNLFIGFGLILTGLGLAGLGRAAVKRHVWAVALAVFFVAYFVLIARAEVKFLRYALPLVPVLAVGAGWIVGRAHVHPNRRWVGLGALGVIGLGGIPGGGLLTTAQATMAMVGKDPRDVVVDTFIERFKAGDDRTIGLVSDPWFYTPPFYRQVGLPRAVPFDSRRQTMIEEFGPGLVQYLPEDHSQRKNWDVRLLDLKPGYVVFSSFETEGLDRVAASGRDPGPFTAQVADYKAFVQKLQAEYDLDLKEPYLPAAWAEVHDMMYVRPTIWVWKRKTGSPTPPSGSSTTSGASVTPVPTR
ncbi:MAG: glycosyltransferase family 39 protein [Armatimonadetes bacterium]|nr:glycosyltransferase family 39 protein [Armatimonadota bacterium]